jgi:hypothetical protein
MTRTIAKDRYVHQPGTGGYSGVGPYMCHLDGVSVQDAPIPGRFHRCWPQTWSLVGLSRFVDRCPCGGVRVNGGRWMERNTA